MCGGCVFADGDVRCGIGEVGRVGRREKERGGWMYVGVCGLCGRN